MKFFFTYKFRLAIIINGVRITLALLAFILKIYLKRCIRLHHHHDQHRHYMAWWPKLPPCLNRNHDDEIIQMCEPSPYAIDVWSIYICCVHTENPTDTHTHTLVHMWNTCICCCCSRIFNPNTNLTLCLMHECMRWIKMDGSLYLSRETKLKSADHIWYKCVQCVCVCACVPYIIQCTFLKVRSFSRIRFIYRDALFAKLIPRRSRAFANRDQPHDAHVCACSLCMRLVCASSPSSCVDMSMCVCVWMCIV